MSVHPIGASWKGRVDAPTADSNKALKVIDERFEELQDFRLSSQPQHWHMCAT